MKKPDKMMLQGPPHKFADATDGRTMRSDMHRITPLEAKAVVKEVLAKEYEGPVTIQVMFDVTFE